MSNQVQVKISLSPQLKDLVSKKAKSLGIPLTQFIKFLIVREVGETIPSYKVSERTEQEAKEALKDLKDAQAVEDVDSFMENL